MAVARALYSDLILMYTPGAATKPSTTDLAAIITQYYKKVYAHYGEAYAAYSASAEHAVIDTEACKDIVISEVSDYANAMNAALHPHAMIANAPRAPKLQLSKEGRNELDALSGFTVKRASYTQDAPVEDG